MRIEPDRAGGAVPPVSVNPGAAAGAETRAASRFDSLVVSQRTGDVDRARQLAAAAPDVRADRVSAVRQQLSAGTYSVALKQLAGRLLETPGRFP